MDLNDIKELLRILGQQEIAEFELEHDGVKLRIRKSAAEGHTRAAEPAANVSRPAAASSGGSALAPAEAPAEDGVIVVKSPMVGTFYRAANPEAPPFVSAGDRIRPGQVLCIIEAMKLMNEIEAEQAGEIVSVLVESGQAVQYGDALFTVRSS